MTLALANVMEDIRRFVEPRSEESGYGFARPPNPHDFHPDRECCTDEEVAAHKAACEAYDAGKYQHDDWDGWNEDRTIHVLRAPWGIGSYTFRDPDAEAILAALPTLLAAIEDGEAKGRRYDWLRNGGWEVAQNPKYWANVSSFDEAIIAAMTDVALDATIAAQGGQE